MIWSHWKGTTGYVLPAAGVSPPDNCSACCSFHSRENVWHLLLSCLATSKADVKEGSNFYTLLLLIQCTDPGVKLTSPRVSRPLFWHFCQHSSLKTIRMHSRPFVSAHFHVWGIAAKDLPLVPIQRLSSDLHKDFGVPGHPRERILLE